MNVQRICKVGGLKELANALDIKWSDFGWKHEGSKVLKEMKTIIDEMQEQINNLNI